MDDYLKGYLDAAIEAQLAVSGGNLFDVLLTPDILLRIGEIFTLEKTEGSFSDLALVFSSTVLGFKAASEMRIRALSALSARFDTVLYSNSPAEGLPIRRLPSVDYWTKAPEVFRRSAVNLNFTIPNIRTGLPLRIYDVLAARGFLMTDYRAELAEQFEIGKELVCFESIPELEEKCAYYLKHEEERKKIAEKGYERVNKDHRIGKRLEVLLRELSI
jgi:spore maturation protein CgeB